MADFLSIARTSYINIEQDKREITLGEADLLANIFGITVEDILEKEMPNLIKYKDIIITFLKLNSGQKKDGKITKTKLAKLVYLADFAWYYENLASMSGMQYKKFEYGPVPDIYFRVLDEMFLNGEVDIENKNGAMLVSINRGNEKEKCENLNKGELKLIEKISRKWEGRNTQDIVNFTHSQMPWKFGREGEVIHYELITQEEEDHVY